MLAPDLVLPQPALVVAPDLGEVNIVVADHVVQEVWFVDLDDRQFFGRLFGLREELRVGSRRLLLPSSLSPVVNASPQADLGDVINGALEAIETVKFCEHFGAQRRRFSCSVGRFFYPSFAA